MVLNIWASWCSPCRAEADDLSRPREQFPDVAFVGLNVRDKRVERRGVRPQQGRPLPQPGQTRTASVLLEFYGLLNVNSLPSTIVVDEDGKVAALVLGRGHRGDLVGTDRRRAEGSLRPVPTPYVAAIGDWFARHGPRRVAAAGRAGRAHRRRRVVLLAVRAAAAAGLPLVHDRAVGGRHRGQRQHRRARPDGDRGLAVRARLLVRVRRDRRRVRPDRATSCSSTRTTSPRSSASSRSCSGLVFAGVVPWLQRDVRVHTVPAVGLGAAPLLGVLFGLGWTPCIGPTLGAVLDLVRTPTGAPSRGAWLAFVYCLGLGLPFLIAAVSFRKMMGAVAWVRRHQLWVMRLRRRDARRSSGS